MSHVVLALLIGPRRARSRRKSVCHRARAFDRAASGRTLLALLSAFLLRSLACKALLLQSKLTVRSGRMVLRLPPSRVGRCTAARDAGRQRQEEEGREGMSVQLLSESFVKGESSLR